MDKMLSVVLPAYNEEQMIKKTAQVVGDLLEKEQIPYELVFVNDGSKDHTWEKILELKSTYQRSLLFQKFWKRRSRFCRDRTGRRRLYCSNGL